jgi:hypothetical protein
MARSALEEHWSGSPADDLETALDKADLIYHDDVVVEYPQSGERILGRRNLRALREAYPATSTSPSGGSAGAGTCVSPST